MVEVSDQVKFICLRQKTDHVYLQCNHNMKFTNSTTINYLPSKWSCLNYTIFFKVTRYFYQKPLLNLKCNCLNKIELIVVICIFID